MSRRARVPGTTTPWEFQHASRHRNRMRRELAERDARDPSDIIARPKSPIELVRGGQVLQAISGFRRKV